jgi:hypothetical protein
MAFKYFMWFAKKSLILFQNQFDLISRTSSVCMTYYYTALGSGNGSNFLLCKLQIEKFKSQCKIHFFLYKKFVCFFTVFCKLWEIKERNENLLPLRKVVFEYFWIAKSGKNIHIVKLKIEKLYQIYCNSPLLILRILNMRNPDCLTVGGGGETTEKPKSKSKLKKQK